jgi:hypothetical protein
MDCFAALLLAMTLMESDSQAGLSGRSLVRPQPRAVRRRRLDTELRDGRTFKLLPGMSYQVSDLEDAAHRSSTKTGAKIFIVD